MDSCPTTSAGALVSVSELRKNYDMQMDEVSIRCTSSVVSESPQRKDSWRYKVGNTKPSGGHQLIEAELMLAATVQALILYEQTRGIKDDVKIFCTFVVVNSRYNSSQQKLDLG